MARIKIDAGELMMAMEDPGGLLSYHLDNETGEILSDSEDRRLAGARTP